MNCATPSRRYNVREVHEYSTRDGAMELAARLRRYWAARGRYVTVDIVRVALADAPNAQVTDGAIWGVKSDIAKALWGTDGKASA